MKNAVSKLVTLMVLLGGSCAAIGQTFPTKPITLVVPFAAGASADGIARVIGREMGAALGQQVLVDNKPGGGGATALITVSKAAPDGYTIGLGATGAIAIGPHLPDSPPLKPDTQLQPLAKLADIPLVVIASSKSGITSLKAAIDKARMSDIPTANAGQYTAQHLSAELLASMTKSRMPAVPYKGSAPAVTDLIGGQLEIGVVDLTSAQPHIKAGTIKALAVTGESRSKIAPEIPTVAEAGVPGYSAPAWMGLFLPKNVPAPIVDRLAKEVAAALSKPEVQKQILALSAEPAYLDASAFSTFVSEQSAKWAQVVASLSKTQK